MVKRVFIHPGFHKTGTTGIQTIFTENRMKCKDAGLFYPYARGEGIIVPHGHFMSEFGAGKIGAERRHPFQNGTI